MTLSQRQQLCPLCPLVIILVTIIRCLMGTFLTTLALTLVMSMSRTTSDMTNTWWRMVSSLLASMVTPMGPHPAILLLIVSITRIPSTPTRARHGSDNTRYTQQLFVILIKTFFHYLFFITFSR